MRLRNATPVLSLLALLIGCASVKPVLVNPALQREAFLGRLLAVYIIPGSPFIAADAKEMTFTDEGRSPTAFSRFFNTGCMAYLKKHTIFRSVFLISDSLPVVEKTLRLNKGNAMQIRLPDKQTVTDIGCNYLLVIDHVTGTAISLDSRRTSDDYKLESLARSTDKTFGMGSKTYSPRVNISFSYALLSPIDEMPLLSGKVSISDPASEIDQEDWENALENAFDQMVKGQSFKSK